MPTSARLAEPVEVDHRAGRVHALRPRGGPSSCRCRPRSPSGRRSPAARRCARRPRARTSPVGQLRFHAGQPLLAEVAEAGVVVAALGVVVVRDHHRRQAADRSTRFEPRHPVRIDAGLVDLVHRHGVRAERQRGGAGQHDHAVRGRARRRAAVGTAVSRQCRSAYVGEPGPAKIHPAARRAAQRPLASQPGRRARCARTPLDRPPDAGGEVATARRGDVVGVGLEAVRGVEQDRRPVTDPLEDGPVRLAPWSARSRRSP